MKKIMLLVCLLMSLSSFADHREMIEVEDMYRDHGSRSIVTLPQIWLDSSIAELSVSIGDDENIYTMTITDSHGNIVLQSDLNTDGNLHQYTLPSVGQGSYTISIKGSDHEYVGSFIL